jgi:hypothetical protein
MESPGAPIAIPAGSNRSACMPLILPAPTECRRAGDATDLLKAEYCHRALREFGPVHAFTLNLRPDIEDKARAKANPCTWLRDRIEAALRKALGRSVPMLLAFEEADCWDARPTSSSRSANS